MQSERKIRDLLELLYGSESEYAFNLLANSLTKWMNETTSRKERGWVDENDVMLITYGDSIRKTGEKPLVTLGSFLWKYARGVISDVHILPMFPYTSDDGFSVKDYYTVDSELGDWDDIKRLSSEYDLMFDAVVNHVSSSSAWFQSFLNSDRIYKDYFIVADPNTDYSKVTRPRALPLLTRVETTEGEKHVWTTFSDDQIDLNFANPRVLVEIIEVLLTYVSKGARFLRLDAIGFAWKELGTSCMHLEKTHALVKLMRAVLDEMFSGTILITETNVPHKDNISYLGDGYDEAHLVYQFPLPPLVLFSFMTGNSVKLGLWIKSLEETVMSEFTTYFNFLASHDGIGMRPVEGILTESEKELMVQTVLKNGGRINFRHNSDGSKVPYELNISYLDALTNPEADEEIGKADKFIAAQSILLALQGVPGIYIHSLIGSQNWYQGVLESGINRRINREKLDFDVLCAELSCENHLRSKIYEKFSRLIKLRRNESAFSPQARQKYEHLDERLVSFSRRNSETNETINVMVNVTGQQFDIQHSFDGFDIVNDEQILRGNLQISPYQVRWIKTK